jgi:hypothetical protein
MHKIVEEQDKAVDVDRHHKFMEFANNSSPVQNAVALSRIHFFLLLPSNL